MASIRLITRKKRWLIGVLCFACALIIYNHTMVIPTMPYRLTELEETLLVGVRNMLTEVSMAGRVGDVKEYTCVPNILSANISRASADVSDVNNVDVTWCTCTTDSNLHYVQTLASAWDAPISVAVFAFGAQAVRTMEYMAALHHCVPNVQAWVSFHLCIPSYGNEGYIALERAMIGHIASCERFMDRTNLSVNYGDEKVAFPVNVLRNVAIKAARTQYVLNADVDMMPSVNLAREFSEFATTFTPDVARPSVFVLPSFETNVSLSGPVSRLTLLDMWMMGQVRQFYVTVCKLCQSNTDYDKWRKLLNENSGNGIRIGFRRIWMFMWEPYLIARRDEVVYFDERFKRYGYNRVSQMCELHMRGTEFLVLENAFLIHDGFKDKETFHASRDEDNARNLKLLLMFMGELFEKYPNSKRYCHRDVLSKPKDPTAKAVDGNTKMGVI